MRTKSRLALDTTELTDDTLPPVMGGQGREDQEAQDMAETLWMLLGLLLCGTLLGAVIALAANAAGGGA